MTDMIPMVALRWNLHIMSHPDANKVRGFYLSLFVLNFASGLKGSFCDDIESVGGMLRNRKSVKDHEQVISLSILAKNNIHISLSPVNNAKQRGKSNICVYI
jgi:hypothetical protein